jgi:S-formylglutathione hydrolase FrmB
VPASYAAHPGARYPVLYLLHGALADWRSWTDAGDAERITAGLNAIVVMPEGGNGGWYTDWFNGGAGGPPEWETFHIDQLIPWIDGHYRTLADRDGRAIAGLSMGVSGR